MVACVALGSHLAGGRRQQLGPPFRLRREDPPARSVVRYKTGHSSLRQLPQSALASRPVRHGNLCARERCQPQTAGDLFLAQKIRLWTTSESPIAPTPKRPERRLGARYP